MIQFLQPIWLWACAGIAIPLIIHLWNVKPGKTLKVGTIAFLSERARTYAKSYKLSQLLLLLVRCLLLISLSCSISKPFWQEEITRDKEKGWVLADRAGLHSAYRQYRFTIDSLLQKGFTFHYFETGFGQADLAEDLRRTPDTAKEKTSSWALLKELNRQLPATLPVYLFTERQSTGVSGSRPSVSLNLKWHTYAAGQKATTWIEEAYETSDDSVMVIIGRGDSAGTSFTQQRISHGASNAVLDIDIRQGTTFVSLKGEMPGRAGRVAQVDTATRTMVVYANKNAGDAGYVIAALRAIADFTKRKLKTTLVSRQELIPQNFSWLFWLSDDNLPAPLQKRNVLAYAQGAIYNGITGAVSNVPPGVAIGWDNPIFKMVRRNEAKRCYASWQNGFGEPLLQSGPRGAPHMFYSRFDPQWNNWVWSNDFPYLIYTLVNESWTKKTGQIVRDQRLIDDKQLQPVRVQKEELLPKEETVRTKPLSRYFWCAAFLLFLLERIMVHFSAKRTSNG